MNACYTFDLMNTCYIIKTLGASLNENLCLIRFSKLFQIVNFLRLVMQNHSGTCRIQEVGQSFIKVQEDLLELL